jgi:glycosyltransferase involved in cell wall biosynthesis
MKTICFFSGDITRGGGTERVATMIANGLAAQGNYQILFLSLVEDNKHPFFEIDEKIKRYALGSKWINPGPGYIKIIPKLRKFLKRKDVDLIIDIDIVLDVLSLPAAKGIRTKVLSWEHFNYTYEMGIFYRRCILKYSVRRSDYVITLTKHDKNSYRKYLHRTKNISAIYNPMENPSPQTDIDTTDLPIKESAQKEKWLITVGHLTYRKGMDYLAKVATSLLKRHPDWKWLLIGDGDQEAFLRETIAAHHLEEQLILTGRITNVGDYLTKAQIYVMTSRMEGLPMCLLEAKSYGLPIVSFRAETGPAELINDGENGYLIDLADCKEMEEKLHLLMEDESLRRKFSSHAKDGLEAYQLEAVLAKWNALLAHLIS